MLHEEVNLLPPSDVLEGKVKRHAADLHGRIPKKKKILSSFLGPSNGHRDHHQLLRIDFNSGANMLNFILGPGKFSLEITMHSSNRAKGTDQ